jgi:nucleoside-diphosphate-sugar epimerase
MTLVAVTGGSGRAGKAIIAELVEHGYDVRNIDRVEHPDVETVTVDLADYAATYEATEGCEVMVHMAANPEPDFDHFAAADRFGHNTLTTYNVFNAAVTREMERVIWASSETVQGLPFDRVRPSRLPLDEDDPLWPQGGYALSKVVSEELARRMHQRYDTTFVGLRFSNVLTVGNTDAGYDAIPSYWEDPRSRSFNLWGYVDSRDVAQSVRRSLESGLGGADVFIIAAGDTIMRQTNEELIAEVMPGIPLRPGIGPHDSLLSSERAGSALGYVPQHSWRDVIDDR